MADPLKQISLVIADDHEVVRRGLTAFIATATDIDLLEAASSGTEAVEACLRHAPDVVLLDLLMPDQDIETSVRQIKKVSPRTQIVILTSHEGDEHVVSVTRAGAISYILKDISPEDLIKAIRHACLGEATLSPRIARALLKAVHPSEKLSLLHENLTNREMDVLQSIAEGHSNQAIAKILGITEKTVKSHVSNVLSKLYLNDRTQAAVYAWREGIVGKKKTTAES